MNTHPAPMIGILGGYGNVGAAAARILAAEGGYRLRIGGRSAAAAWRIARPHGARAPAPRAGTDKQQAQPPPSRVLI